MSNDICLLYNSTGRFIEIANYVRTSDTDVGKIPRSDQIVEINKFTDLMQSKFIKKYRDVGPQTSIEQFMLVSLSKDIQTGVKLLREEIGDNRGFVIRMGENNRLEKVPVSKEESENESKVDLEKRLTSIAKRLDQAEKEAMKADRRIGVAIDFSACSKKALLWAVYNVARKGDHLILVNIQPEGYSTTETNSSSCIPLHELSDPPVMKKNYGFIADAETLTILNRAREKEIVVLLKIYSGDVGMKLCESINTIPLDCIVIGNRGLDKRSVSSYVVNKASCPVTVVKNVEDD